MDSESSSSTESEQFSESMFANMIPSNISHHVSSLNQNNQSTNVNNNQHSFGRFWSENIKICEMITQAIQDITRDMDPIGAVLILVALIIAIVGVIAIICQCHMWKKSKRQRHYDTTSWLEYSLDREKLTKDNSQPSLPPHHQHHINNNNNLHNNIKLQRSMDSNNKMGSKLFPTPLRPISGPNSDHYSFRTPIGTKSSIVDIDQCQLVQSFMKHDQSGKQYLENMKKDKKHDGNNDLKKKKIKKDKMLVEKPKKNLFKRNNKIFDEMNERRLDTFPFFPPSLSSLSSTTKLTDISGTNRNLSGMRKEYETQTLELNLTGSDDGDSHTNLSIDEKIYERIANPTSVNTNTTLVMQIPTKRSPSPPIQSTRKINEEYGNIRKSRQLIPPNHITNNNYLPNGFNYHKSVKPQSTSGVSTLSKNPLYNEISDELFVNSEHNISPKSSVIGGFALEHDSRSANYSQMAYSTFIKAPSPPV